ncbi:MAG TPA: CinA family protein [Candidatus Thioglobus sp.]|jgi:nicotinamide-nucleotide amidase|nr:CinA family protein [Candidatus Thioglobus sp.]HIL21085.1 CinA family protein [Candidatus Thioglobus sp.]
MTEKIQILAKLLIDGDLTISVAESCTGGALASALTSISGASSYFDRGYIAYSNIAKVDMLKVEPQIIGAEGAVSEAVAIAMVKGAVSQSSSDIAVAITGIAGPTGGTKAKPIGTICFGFCIKNNLSTSTQSFQGTREEVVNQSVGFALNHLISSL